MILNGSPRAPRSNSKRYAEMFSACSKEPSEYFNISRTNHSELITEMGKYTDVLLVFPLYADGLPVGLLNFLKSMEEFPPASRPRISVLINCGFLEYSQNATAVRMVKCFCDINGYPFGSVLMIGSGEAILDSPFRFMVKRKIRKFAMSLFRKQYGVFHTTMPLSKGIFLAASTQYWTNYGKRNGITRKQMQTMRIEG